ALKYSVARRPSRPKKLKRLCPCQSRQSKAASFRAEEDNELSSTDNTASSFKNQSWQSRLNRRAGGMSLDRYSTPTCTSPRRTLLVTLLRGSSQASSLGLPGQLERIRIRSSASTSERPKYNLVDFKPCELKFNPTIRGIMPVSSITRETHGKAAEPSRASSRSW